MELYFNAEDLHDSSGEYIAWCDGMGTGQAMGSSLSRAAGFIFKLHRAFSDALERLPGDHKVRVYPLVDGMYVTTPDRKHFQKVLGDAFCSLAKEFIATKTFGQRFMVRGGIAYGATIHGSDVSEDAFVEKIGTPQETEKRAAFRTSHLNRLRSQLLLGAGLVPSYTSESFAPPFGFYVDDSALTVPQLVDTNDKWFSTKLWRWWDGDPDLKVVAQELWPILCTHYAEALKRSREIGYPIESVLRHKSWAEEYYQEFPPPSAAGT